MSQRILNINDFSSEGYVLQPHYRYGKPPTKLTKADRNFDPRVDKKTDNPELVTTLRDHSAFAAKFPAPVKLVMIVKAPQSDKHYYPKELEHLREFFGSAMNAEANRSPAFFTQLGVIQVFQGLTSPTPYYHFDFGRTYIARDRNTTTYLLDQPLIITPELKSIFEKAAQPPELARVYFQESVDWSTLQSGEARTKRFRHFEIATHNHMVLHKGSSHSLGTLVTLSYMTDYLAKNADFVVSDNPMRPSLSRPKSKPIEQSGPLLAAYLAKLG